MKIASVLAVVVVPVSMAMPALAGDSNGVEVICGIEGSAKVAIKAFNKNEYPMKCNVVCTIKNGKGENVEVKVTDKEVKGPESTWQTLFEQEMSEGPYTPS